VGPLVDEVAGRFVTAWLDPGTEIIVAMRHGCS
jgi:hypothetical protein